MFRSPNGWRGPCHFLPLNPSMRYELEVTECLNPVYSSRGALSSSNVWSTDAPKNCPLTARTKAKILIQGYAGLYPGYDQDLRLSRRRGGVSNCHFLCAL